MVDFPPCLNIEPGLQELLHQECHCVTARMGVLKFWLSAVIVDVVCNSTQMFHTSLNFRKIDDVSQNCVRFPERVCVSVCLCVCDT